MNNKTGVTRNHPVSEEALKPVTIMRNVYTVFPSLAMLAAMQLDVFTPLKDGPLDANALAEALNVRKEKLRPLLYLLVAADLLTVENERFSNTAEAAKFLVKGLPDYIGGLSGLYSMFADAGLKTAATLRTGEPQAKFDFHALSEDELMAYFKKQIHSSLSSGREIADKIDFAQFTHLLDAGGGTGGVAMAVCQKYPHLKATVADLPKVAKLTAHFIAEAEMSGRIKALPVDLCLDAPAGQYDAAILRALIQTLSFQEAQQCLANIGRAISPGGRIFIVGSVLDNSRLGPPAALANSLVYLNVYEHGASYTESEYDQMLSAAGFTGVTVTHEVFKDGASLVSATKH